MLKVDYIQTAIIKQWAAESTLSKYPGGLFHAHFTGGIPIEQADEVSKLPLYQRHQN